MQATEHPRKLALFLPTLDDGGAERVMLQLGASFAARGHQVDLVLAVPDGPLRSQVPSSVRTVQLDAPRSIRALPRLVLYLQQERPAALLSTLEHSNVLAIWARLLSRTGVRVVLREASVLPPRLRLSGLRPQLLRSLMRRSYGSANALVAVSRSVAESMVDTLGVPPRAVRIIYNPVITDDLHRRAAAAVDDPWFAPGAPPVVLGAGRLVPAKDFSTLLRAFAIVRARRRAHLMVLGQGSEREKLLGLIGELGLQDDARLAGFDHNPFRYMARSAVFATSSLYEGLPGALIQAMACGCRVIATDCYGGSREVLTDSRGRLAGPLVPMHDHEALARGIVDLLDAHARGPSRVDYDLERFREGSTVNEYLEVLGVGEAA